MMQVTPFCNRKRLTTQRVKPVREKIDTVFFNLCKDVDSPRSLAAWLCFKYDHAALVDLKLLPENYGDSRIASYNTHATPQAFAYDLNVTEFLSKAEFLNLGVDTSSVAIQSFEKTELDVKRFNSVLKRFQSAPQSARLEAIISIARRKISRVLGLRSDAVFEFGWGPGSTVSVKEDVGWDKKILEKRISVTASALPLARCVIGADSHWCHARGIMAEGPCSLINTEFEVVSGSNITTVPKNAKTDRVILIEPSANIYLQKGIGSWIRRRLKKICRIDLNDQTTNQKFAGRLSYATIDLKAASDSICKELVRLLLPDEWVFLLGLVRSPGYKSGTLPISAELHKWSGMGNGYTFELESLLFWALCSSAISVDSDESHVLVYGDDILVPVEHAETCIHALQEFGFSVNEKKTHFKYLYRESCGAHFYDGIIVTPIYQKESLNHVERLHHLANRLRHYASRLGGHHYSDSVVFNAWYSAIGLIKKHGPLRYLPYTIKHGEKDDVCDTPSGAAHFSIEDCELFGLPIFLYGTKSKVLRFVSKKRMFDQAAGYCYKLQQSVDLQGSDDLSLRGRGKYVERFVRSPHNFCSNAWL